MTRWLWVWFVLLLTFPVMPVARLMSGRPGTSATASASVAGAIGTAPAAEWNGPLAGVIDRLDWVEGHRAAAADLRGHTVIVEFWTFECVNCRRTQPAMHALAKRYAGSDVRIVSIHTPELPRERDPAAVARAVAAAGIEYPVALDGDLAAWRAFENRYWPCLYVLDGEGRVRYRHIGELHEGSAGWNDLLRRVDRESGGPKPAAVRAG